MAQILYKDIIKNKEINEFIKKGDANLATLGYTEHSKTHCTLVAERAAYLLEKFGHADAEIELAKIAAREIPSVCAISCTFSPEESNARSTSRSRSVKLYCSPKAVNLSIVDRPVCLSSGSTAPPVCGINADAVSSMLLSSIPIRMFWYENANTLIRKKRMTATIITSYRTEANPPANVMIISAHTLFTARPNPAQSFGFAL
mgnify:CR=1 FL=1